MSITVMERVYFRDNMFASSSAHEAVGQELTVSVSTETRWMDEEDDGVAVRSYD